MSSTGVGATTFLLTAGETVLDFAVKPPITPPELAPALALAEALEEALPPAVTFLAYGDATFLEVSDKPPGIPASCLFALGA